MQHSLLFPHRHGHPQNYISAYIIKIEKGKKEDVIFQATGRLGDSLNNGHLWILEAIERDKMELEQVIAAKCNMGTFLGKKEAFLAFVCN